MKISEYTKQLQTWLTVERCRLLAAIYFVGLMLLMWLPLGGVPLDNYVFGLRADHIVHATLYMPCTLALSWLVPRARWSWLVVALLIGATTESVQYLLPWRGFDITDMIANTLGALVGYGLRLWWIARH